MQPFAFAQASRSADGHNLPSTSRTLGHFGKRGRPEASTAASHGRPTCASIVREVGSSRFEHLLLEKVGHGLAQVEQRARHPRRHKHVPPRNDAPR